LRATLLALALTLVAAAPASASTRLVRYDVTGGLTAVSEHLFVNSDGSARQSGSVSRRFQLSAAQLRKLKRDLHTARFDKLKHHYEPEEPVLDATTADVRYKGHSVSVYANPKLPKGLARVIRRLDSLMR
jgi:hypothetical protein